MHKLSNKRLSFTHTYTHTPSFAYRVHRRLSHTVHTGCFISATSATHPNVLHSVCWSVLRVHICVWVPRKCHAHIFELFKWNNALWGRLESVLNAHTHAHMSTTYASYVCAYVQRQRQLKRTAFWRVCSAGCFCVKPTRKSDSLLRRVASVVCVREAHNVPRCARAYSKTRNLLPDLREFAQCDDDDGWLVCWEGRSGKSTVRTYGSCELFRAKSPRAHGTSSQTHKNDAQAPAKRRRKRAVCEQLTI